MKAAHYPTEIADGIFMVGSGRLDRGLNCNPYLLVNNGRGVLIDPGSVLDGEDVLRNVKRLMPLKKIEYVILQHQDPDLCACVPYFEKKGLRARIATSTRASLLIQYYGIRSDYYLVNENKYKLDLDGGRALRFIPAPYLHFPGAFMTYDVRSKALFTSDLFGAFSNTPNLWADAGYMESMKIFHERYMPSNDILRPVMELLLDMEISLIAPQHGSIIRKNVRDYIIALRDLECGTFLNPVIRNIVLAGNYRGLCDQVLKRYYAMFPADEVSGIFAGSAIILDAKTGRIDDFRGVEHEIWDDFFDLVLSKKGVNWLIAAETLVMKFVKSYNIPYPAVYRTVILNAESLHRMLREEIVRLKNGEAHSGQNPGDARDAANINQCTGLNNEKYFLECMNGVIGRALTDGENFAALFIEIDNLIQINNKYGRDAGDETLAHFAYLLKEFKRENDGRSAHMLFKLDGPVFCYYMPHSPAEDAGVMADAIRRLTTRADMFITGITVSVGVVKFSDIDENGKTPSELVALLYDTGRMKVRVARKMGADTVYDKSVFDVRHESAGDIVIADTDRMNVNILKKTFEGMNYRVVACADGAEAMEVIDRENPSLVISEYMLPKMDGLTIRQRMLESSRLKDIPFVLVSYEKSEQTLQRALALKIRHYFKKPFMLTELAGISKCLMEDRI